jgi:hypothetical protein
MSKRIAAIAATLLTAGALAFAASPAHATTLTCTNTEGVTTVVGAAYGCGGLAFNGDSGGFSLADTVNSLGNSYDSAPIVIEPSNETSPRLDFTVFNVCSTGNTRHTGKNGSGNNYPVNKCSPETTAPLVTPNCDGETNVPTTTGVACPALPETLSGPGALGIYVALITPNGKVPDFTVTGGNDSTDPLTGATGTCNQVEGQTYTNTIPCPGETFTAGPETYAISVAEYVGPNGKDRWWALDRQASTNGTFTYGTAITPGTVSWSSANQWQEWAPTIGSAGLLMDNISLDNINNSEYDLNVTGNKFTAGTQLQAYQDNNGGVVNDMATYTACTPPGTLLSVFGQYGLC